LLAPRYTDTLEKDSLKQMVSLSTSTLHMKRKLSKVPLVKSEVIDSKEKTSKNANLAKSIKSYKTYQESPWCPLRDGYHYFDVLVYLERKKEMHDCST
jgi:hypothetical protein